MKGRGNPPVRHRGAAARGARRSVEARDRARGRVRAVHPRARGGGLRAGVRRVPRRASTWSGSANGTDALTIALLAPGRRARATTWSCRRSPSTRAPRRFPTPARGPVFCDVDPETFCVTAGDGRARRSRRPRRAVIAVDLFGTRGAGRRAARAPRRPRASRCSRTPRRPPARACAGKRAGALGDVATFSFFPSKNLFCLGDGGAIATDDDGDRRARARCCASTARATRRPSRAVGWNSRLDAIQAAVLRVTLARLDEWNERRRALAAAYAAGGPRGHRRAAACPRRARSPSITCS